MDAGARKHIRQCWGCDCDGVSHQSKLRPVGAQKFVVDAMADAIEKLTGYRPPTCPWRAMYDPLVPEVIRVAALADKGLGMAALDDDPPAILIDALSIYLAAKAATRSHDEAEEHRERMAELKRRK